LRRRRGQRLIHGDLRSRLRYRKRHDDNRRRRVRLTPGGAIRRVVGGAFGRDAAQRLPAFAQLILLRSFITLFGRVLLRDADHDGDARQREKGGDSERGVRTVWCARRSVVACGDLHHVLAERVIVVVFDALSHVAA